MFRCSRQVVIKGLKRDLLESRLVRNEEPNEQSGEESEKQHKCYDRIVFDAGIDARTFLYMTIRPPLGCRGRHHPGSLHP